MGNLIDRIYKIIDYKSVSVSEFSKKISVSNGYLAKQKANNANIGSHIIEKIVREFSEINPTWLLTGDGEMILNISKETDVKSKDQDEDNYDKFYKNLVRVQRFVDIFDKNRHSELYKTISYHCNAISGYVEHYSIFNKSQQLEDETDKKELLKRIQQILNTEKEVLKIMEPYNGIISELYEKLSDFDEKHDQAFCLDEETEERIEEALKEITGNT